MLRPWFRGMFNKFTFIDLFAGIGGTRLAFEAAGGRCVFSSEWDEFACQTYEANHGDRPRADITQIASFEIPQHDILVGGFPCQPFSIAGVTKNNALGREHGFRHEAQGTLFFEIARIIEATQPRAFLLENVRGLLSHDKGRTFEIVQQTLEDELGYDLHPDIIDASVCLPQHRERVYLVGFREPVEFKFPTFEKDRTQLRDVIEPEVDERYILSDHLWNYLQDYAEKHRKRGNGFGFGLVTDPSGVTRTLSARYYKDGSEILIPTLTGRPRRLTPRECARLMGFPDSFKIPVSDTQAYKQFGNSVAVPVVAEIAQRIASVLSGRKSPDGYVNGRIKVTFVNGVPKNGNHVGYQAKLLEPSAKMARSKHQRLSVAQAD